MQLTSRMASHVNDLTVQVIKEDWSLPAGPASPSSAPLSRPISSTPGTVRYSYEPRTSKPSPLTENTSGVYPQMAVSSMDSNNPGAQVGHYSLNPRLQQDSHFSQQVHV